jgi:galactonate dehydratase
LMKKPGLGIDVDEEAVRERSKSGHRWTAPEWTHRDGSLAEW